MSIRRPSLAGVLWALFWIGVLMWIISDPTGAAGTVRGLAGWVTGGAKSFVVFLQSLAPAG